MDNREGGVWGSEEKEGVFKGGLHVSTAVYSTLVKCQDHAVEMILCKHKEGESLL